MMYLTLLKYGIVATVGAMLMLFVYATPLIDGLEKQIAQIKEADAEATATLLAQAAAKQREFDDERIRITTQYQAERQAADKRAADLSSRVVLLNSAIDAFAKSGSVGVPQAGSGPGDNEVSYSLAGMVKRCNVLLQRGQQLGDGAAIQIRALESNLGATR